MDNSAAGDNIAGDSYGMLKLLVSTDDLTLLGVHIFGSNATEMVHIGQAVMGLPRHRRLPGRRGVQLPDVFRGLQGGRTGRDDKVRALRQFTG